MTQRRREAGMHAVPDQVDAFSLLADKNEAIVEVGFRFLSYRLVDGRTCCQPGNELNGIDTPDGTIQLIPRTINAPKDAKNHFVSMIEGTYIAPFDADRWDDYFVFVVLYDASSLRPLRWWSPKNAEFADATAISPDGRYVAGLVSRLDNVTGVFDHWCIVWDVRTGKPVHDPLFKTSDKTGSPRSGLAFSNNGKLLAIPTRFNQISIFDVAKGRRTGTFMLLEKAKEDPSADPTLSIMRFSNDGRRLYVGTRNAGLFIWDHPGQKPAGDRPPSQSIPLSKLTGKVAAPREKP